MEVEHKFPTSALASLGGEERQKPKPITTVTDSILQQPKQSEVHEAIHPLQSSRLGKRKTDQNIVESFGELNQFNQTQAKLRKLLVEELEQSKDMYHQIQSLQNVSKELESLKN